MLISCRGGPTDEGDELGLPPRNPDRHPRLAEKLYSQASQCFTEVEDFESLFLPLCIIFRGV